MRAAHSLNTFITLLTHLLSAQMGKSGSKPSPEFESPWRKFDWGEKAKLKAQLENFSVSNPDVTCVRILVAGQTGAGKSSFINSVLSVFEERIVIDALTASTEAPSTSFTQKLSTFPIRNQDKLLPFVISDVMGLEGEYKSGLQEDDVISTIFGHVMEDYKFRTDNPITSEDQLYKHGPSVSDQTFCLVYVIAADTVQIADDRLFKKLKFIRNKISEKGLPQVVVMTKVDEACPLVKKDLRKIYTSKKIKELMEICSLKVGIPMNCIFPVRNYHEEINTEDDVDVLILKALDQIVHSAYNRVRKSALI